ncbi:hypothetical protein KCU73_g9387, partial [Aureobasidium melanogenum]
MKASLWASGLVLGSLASSAIANPLEARAFGVRTTTITATTTQTNTVTKYKTSTQTQTVTEIEKEIIKKTKTKTVVSSTTVTVPTTVTKVSTRNVPGPTTTKTVLSSTTLVVNRPTTTTAYRTSTLPAQTILSIKTLLPSTVIVTKTLPASTIISTKTIQSVRTSVFSAPAQTVTSVIVTEIPGPTITDLSIATITAVSTTFINNGNETCGSLSTSLSNLNLTTSAIPYPTLTSSNLTTPATSSAAAASSTAGYANVKTATCDSAPAYYIQVSNSGTSIDNTVLCNQGGPGSEGSWMYMYPPASAETLASLGVGDMIPQPFVYDQQTGDLVSYWNNEESLIAYTTTPDDTRAGFVYSGSRDPPLSCGLEGSTLVNCGSNYTGSFQLGVRVEGSGDWLYMLRVEGGDNYDSENDHDATFTLIPACDLNGENGSSTSTSATSSPTLAAASTTSSSAAATSTAPAYVNVITTTCEDPHAYYIEMTDSGTPADGTVMCNGYAGNPDNWLYFDA